MRSDEPGREQARAMWRDHARAQWRFTRLQLPGYIAGIIASVGVAVFGTGPAKVFLVPAVGVAAFQAFYFQAKRAQAHSAKAANQPASNRSKQT